MKAPDFNLPDQNGVEHSLKDYRGRWVVLYFYPSDRSLNCTREACNFRDEYKVISQFGNAEVIGVNKAPAAKHKQFAQRHHINFPILSDLGHRVTGAYGAWRSGPTKFYDRPFGTRRNTYIINPEGEIVKTFTKVNPRNHAEEVITALRELQDQAKS